MVVKDGLRQQEDTMKHSIFIAIAIVTAVATGIARADTVTDWNQIAIEVMKAANIRVGSGPGLRTLAMVHVAMSDAINSVQSRYTRYVATVPVIPGASAEMAAAAAARQILVQLYPNQKAMIDDAYAGFVKSIPDGAAKSDGISLGEQVAAAVQADRAADGTSVPDTYRPMTSPGVWVPTTPPQFAQYARAKPWVLKSADQFRPGPPSQLSSALYARDYNETKTLGGAKSTARTPEQTAAVKFWDIQTLAPAWQAAARQLSAAKGLSLAENARLFALLNMGVANSVIADWDAKFTYNFWRPVTAIRNGDMDGNDATERDPSWTPLEPTPMHPEYPSQAAIAAGVAVGVLESVFGSKPGTTITATAFMDPKLTRQFNSVSQMAEEHRNVRVWGGIHFRNSLEVGHDMGKKIAAYLIDNSLKPVR
jgi:hypothetical protein